MDNVLPKFKSGKLHDDENFAKKKCSTAFWVIKQAAFFRQYYLRENVFI